MKENVRKIKFESLDKKFGGAVIYYPTPKRKLGETVIPAKAIDVSDPLKIKVVSIKVSKKECAAFKKYFKPICDTIREDMIKACTKDVCNPWMPEVDHKWIYFNYERRCKLCERIEPYWDKIRKACNPQVQANSIVKEDKE